MNELCPLAAAIEAGNVPLPPFIGKLIQNAPESFDDPRAGQVAVTVRAMRHAGEPVTFNTVAEKHVPLVTFILCDLGTSTLTLEQSEFYAADFWQAFQLRRTQSIFADAHEAIIKAPEQRQAITEGVRVALDAVASDSQTASQPPAAKSLGDLKRRTADDPNELLRTGYLCRCAGLLIAAPSGIGKSSFAIMAMILWAIGRAIFGIAPVRPLKSLLIQAENDDGDLAEMRDGVIAGMDLTDEEKKMALENIIVVHENTRTGRAFFDYTVAPLLELHRPDLLWIDPALAYLGGDVSSQKDVGFFLRNLLNPLLSQFNCGCVVIHHTNKPSKGEEKSAWQAGEFAYLGSGSAEWANWARAVLAIRSIGSHEIFELRAGKRGSRIGWKDTDGKTSFARLIGHATEPGVICWRTATEDETPAGKPRRAGTREDLTALVPLEKPVAKSLLIDQWKDHYGNKDKGRAFLDALIADGKLFEWRLTRPGTNAAKLICRKPQQAE